MARILHKRSSVPAKVPSVADLLDGEISINTADGRLYIKKTVDSVQSVVSISSDYNDLINIPQDLHTTASPSFTNLSVTTTGSIANLLVTSSTASTSPTTGALKVTGGTGIGGALNVAGNITVAATTASTTTSNGALTVAGGVGVGGTLRVGGGLYVTNNGFTWIFNSAGKLMLPAGGDIVDRYGVSVLGGTGGGGGTGGALAPTAVQTTNYTAAANDLVRCDSTISGFIVSLPYDVIDGTIIGIFDIYGTFGDHPVTILPGAGDHIENDASGFLFDVTDTYVTMSYVSITNNWRILVTPLASAPSVNRLDGGSSA